MKGLTGRRAAAEGLLRLSQDARRVPQGPRRGADRPRPTTTTPRRPSARSSSARPPSARSRWPTTSTSAAPWPRPPRRTRCSRRWATRATAARAIAGWSSASGAAPSATCTRRTASSTATSAAAAASRPGKPVPAGLHWDEWLGPAPYREYHDGLHPFSWRSWRQFGTGTLGDMACHVMDGVFWALKLGEAKTVHASSACRRQGGSDEMFPQSNVSSSSSPPAATCRRSRSSPTTTRARSPQVIKDVEKLARPRVQRRHGVRRREGLHVHRHLRRRRAASCPSRGSRSSRMPPKDPAPRPRRPHRGPVLGDARTTARPARTSSTTPAASPR